MLLTTVTAKKCCTFLVVDINNSSLNNVLYTQDFIQMGTQNNIYFFTFTDLSFAFADNARLLWIRAQRGTVAVNTSVSILLTIYNPFICFHPYQNNFP